MIEVQIYAQGIMQMQNKLDCLNQGLIRRVDDTLNQETTEIQNAAKELAPKRTGNLASSIFTEKTGEWAFKLGARADYAVFLEFGTRCLQARRFIAQTLEFALPRLIQRVNNAVDEGIKEAATS